MKTHQTQTNNIKHFNINAIQITNNFLIVFLKAQKKMTGQ
jgi:hypothetical protein